MHCRTDLMSAGASTLVFLAWKFLKRTRRQEAPLATQMTADEVRRVVMTTREHVSFAESSRANAVVSDGRVVWNVASVTVGSGWTAIVDDETGECVEFKT